MRLAALLCIGLLVPSATGAGLTRTPTLTATPTRTQTRTSTATATPTRTRTRTASPTATPTRTATHTATGTDTQPPTLTPTATATYTVQYHSGCQRFPDFTANGVNQTSLLQCRAETCRPACLPPWVGQAAVVCSAYDGSWTLTQPCDTQAWPLNASFGDSSRTVFTAVTLSLAVPSSIMVGNRLRLLLPPAFQTNTCDGGPAGPLLCASAGSLTANGTTVSVPTDITNNEVLFRFGSNVTLTGPAALTITNVLLPNRCDVPVSYLVQAGYCPPGAQRRPLCLALPYKWARSDAAGVVPQGCSACDACVPAFQLGGVQYYTCNENGMDFLRSALPDTCGAVQLF